MRYAHWQSRDMRAGWQRIYKEQPTHQSTDDPTWRVLGFGGGGKIGSHFWFVNVPFWFIVLATLVLPACVFTAAARDRIRRRRERKRGRS